MKYSPNENEVVDINFAMTEFVNTLHIAGKLAAKKKNFKALMQVNERWLQLMSSIEEEVEEKPFYGFGGGSLERKEDDGEPIDED